MSSIVRIGEIKKYNKQVVTIHCWLYNSRSSGKISFLELRDGSLQTLQAIVSNHDCDEDSFQLAKKLTQESSISVTGAVKEHHKKVGTYEIDVHKIELVQMAEPSYPISHKEHGVEFLMQNRHLWLRTPRQVAILRTRAKINSLIRNFFDERGFVLMDPPILTPSACEGTSDLFETEYFDSRAYLTQSGQLYAEAGAMALGKTYTFAPTFRAEKSKTRKHLTEFWMIEPEVAFCDMNGVMDLAQEFITTVVKNVLEVCGEELTTLGRDRSDLELLTQKTFPVISYEEAIDVLNKHGGSLKWGDDFGAPEETKLGSIFKGMPVFIKEFPKEMKSFYFKQNDKDPRTVLGFDLIAPHGYGEIIGGSEREFDVDILKKNIQQYGLDEKEYEWYLDLRRYGSVPHAGFGLGLERMVAWICGLDHVRETIPFPRMINYIRP